MTALAFDHRLAQHRTFHLSKTNSVDRMNSSPPSQSLSGVGASSPTSAPAPPPPCVATSLNDLADISLTEFFPELRSLESDKSETPTFNDPFTGIPSAPSDTVRLYMLCRAEPRYCCFSIPGSLFFLFMYAPPWQADSRPFKRQMLPGMRPFQLNCKQQYHTYLRLYTEWLFSGGAPSSLAKLHHGIDGSTSMSFSAQVRASIYLLRLYQSRGYALSRSLTKIMEIFTSAEIISVPEEAWYNVVVQTEPIETPTEVWPHAYPRPTSPTASAPPTDSRPPFSQSSNTTVQTEPFRGVASLQPTEPNDVPPGWFHWIPQVLSRTQSIAREAALEFKRFQRLEHVDSGVAAPSHETHLYWAARDLRPPSPNTTAGAEDEDVDMARSGADDNNDPAQNLRTQLVHRLTQARPTNTLAPTDNDTPRCGRGRLRKSATPALTIPVIKPTRLRIVAPHRPSTPEQTAFFEEAMNDQSPTHAYIPEFEKVQKTYKEVFDGVRTILRKDVKWQMEETRYGNGRVRRSERERISSDCYQYDPSCESVLFNPEDWGGKPDWL